MRVATYRKEGILIMAKKQNRTGQTGFLHDAQMRLYKTNSDDEIQSIIEELRFEGYDEITINGLIENLASYKLTQDEENEKRREDETMTNYKKTFTDLFEKEKNPLTATRIYPFGTYEAHTVAASINNKTGELILDLLLKDYENGKFYAIRRVFKGGGTEYVYNVICDTHGKRYQTLEDALKATQENPWYFEYVTNIVNGKEFRNFNPIRQNATTIADIEEIETSNNIESIF